jgi:hypothetical protein
MDYPNSPITAEPRLQRARGRFLRFDEQELLDAAREQAFAEGSDPGTDFGRPRTDVALELGELPIRKTSGIGEGGEVVKGLFADSHSKFDSCASLERVVQRTIFAPTTGSAPAKSAAADVNFN